MYIFYLQLQGFKRVYHKEEFQRTEHFYDDEEAKKIAESYGLTDQKEKSNHGTKQDKRKYHVSVLIFSVQCSVVQYLLLISLLYLLSL